jgi:hypothetical protein
MQRLFPLLRAGTMCLAALIGLTTLAQAQGRYGNSGYDRSGGAGGYGDPAYGSGRLASVGLEFTLRGYAAAPDGVAIEGNFFFNDIDYDDTFDDGVGFGLVTHLPIFTRETAGGALEFALGPLLAIDRISYAGAGENSVWVAGVKPEDLDITTVLAGFHIRLRAGRSTSPVRFLFGAHAAIGLAMIDEVNLTGTGPGPAVGLYDATSTFAFELQLRPGLSIDLHPRVQLNLFVLFGFGIIGAPDDGDNSGADAGPILNGVYGGGLSVTIRFGG